jgi:alkylated DNA repair dioxygenase AlkB
MNLFSASDTPISAFDTPRNLLPYDGTVLYFGKIFSHANADASLAYLLESIAWQNDQARIFGKIITTKRMVAWYGDKPFEYTYSHISKYALAWTQQLLSLKHSAEHVSHETYNSCLLNLYHNGSEGMAWHSDGEKDLKKNGAIASLSFGAERKFSFKHKQSGERVSLLLEHGSLLIMAGTTQTHWLHRLPPTATINTPRVNLTFRTIVENAIS